MEMLNEYSSELQIFPESGPTKDFLMEEIQFLEEANGIRLQNFLPHTAFFSLLRTKVERISKFSIKFIEKVWTYLENVVKTVLMDHSEL